MGTIVTFSQRGGAFFRCPSKLMWSQVPEKLDKVLEAKSGEQIVLLALGSQDSFVLIGTRDNGSWTICCEGLPLAVQSFLLQEDDGRWARALPNLLFVLGPYNTSYYVSDGKKAIQRGLPAMLQQALSTNTRSGQTTRVLSLGHDGDFVLISDSHRPSYVLQHYPTLKACLAELQQKGGSFEAIADVNLNPYRIDCFAIQFHNSAVLFNNVPDHISRLADGFTAETQARAAAQERADREAEQEYERQVRLATLRREAEAVQERELLEGQILMLQRQQRRMQQAAALGAVVGLFTDLSLLASMNNSF